MFGAIHKWPAGRLKGNPILTCPSISGSDQFWESRGRVFEVTLRFDYATVEDSFYSAAMDYIFYVVSVSVFVAMLARKWLEIEISKFSGSFFDELSMCFRIIRVSSFYN